MKPRYAIYIYLISVLSESIGSSPLTVHKVATLAPWVEGSDGRLKCFFSLKPKERLAGVEFFRNDYPIYHYRRGYQNWFKDQGPPSKFTFSLKHFNVDKKKSTNDTAYIRDLRLSAKGRYTCTVEVMFPEVDEKDSPGCDIKVLPTNDKKKKLKLRRFKVQKPKGFEWQGDVRESSEES